MKGTWASNVYLIVGKCINDSHNIAMPTGLSKDCPVVQCAHLLSSPCYESFSGYIGKARQTLGESISLILHMKTMFTQGFVS